MLYVVCGSNDRTTSFHGKRLVGVGRFLLGDNMEGQTSGGTRVVEAVGTVGQEDDHHEGVSEGPGTQINTI